MRWTLGLVLGFAVVFAVNGYMLYVALQNPVQVEQSYQDLTQR